MLFLYDIILPDILFNSRLGGWINLKVGMSLFQADSCILSKLQVRPIKTAKVAFFHLLLFNWRHIQWFFSLTYTDSAFFLLKNKENILEKGWNLGELWAKNYQVSFILEQTLVYFSRNWLLNTTWGNNELIGVIMN